MIRTASAAVIALPLMALPALAQTPARTCPLPQIADSAALEPASGSDLMLVPVTVNGQTQKFLLDIGLKKPTTISAAATDRLALPEKAKFNGTTTFPGGAGFAGGVSAGGNSLPYYDAGPNTADWLLGNNVTVKSFGVGRATTQHLEMAVAQKGTIEATGPFDGYMTGAFFRQYDFELDFAGHRITWLTPTNCNDPDQTVFWAHSDVAVIPITLAADGQFSMQAMVGGHLINAELNTTAPRTVMRRDIAELYVGLKADTPAMMPLGDLKDGMHMQIYTHTFPEMLFAGGGVTVKNMTALIQNYSMIPSLARRPSPRHPGTTERIPDLVIGMDVLSKLHMYVVPGQGKIYVTPAEAPMQKAAN